MTHLWHHLDANEQAVLTCMLTCCVGLFIGAAVTWWRIRTPQTVLDDYDVQEYRDSAVIDWSNEVWAELDRAES